jgi:hypothetical protein
MKLVEANVVRPAVVEHYAMFVLTLVYPTCVCCRDPHWSVWRAYGVSTN